MPKCYTNQEKDEIKRRLMEEAGYCMAQYGIKKTTVDELVKRVGIPKGTFYLFYESKERLLWEVILVAHEQMERKMAEKVAAVDLTGDTLDALTDLFLGFYQMAEEMPVLQILNSEEMNLLTKKIPAEEIAAHQKEDTVEISRLFAQIPLCDGVDIGAVTAAFHAIYFATLERDKIAPEDYEKGLRLLIGGVLMQILA